MFLLTTRLEILQMALQKNPKDDTTDYNSIDTTNYHIDPSKYTTDVNVKEETNYYTNDTYHYIHIITNLQKILMILPLIITLSTL